jgi:hypothetical protein
VNVTILTRIADLNSLVRAYLTGSAPIRWRSERQGKDERQLDTVLLAVPATSIGKRLPTVRVCARADHGSKARAWPLPGLLGQPVDHTGQEEHEGPSPTFRVKQVHVFELELLAVGPNGRNPAYRPAHRHHRVRTCGKWLWPGTSWSDDLSTIGNI